MRILGALFFAGMLVQSCSPAETNNEEEVETTEQEEVVVTEEESFEYDATYAAKLGADDYGMKTYVMAFLKRGPNRPEDQALIDSLQGEHMANIGKLADEGKLVVAGPFYGDDDLRGIYIFDTDSIEEAASWTATDPAIIYGSLEMELMKWYGSAALMDVNNLHKKAAKINF
jgi:uncharacterized protein YciI